MANRMRDQARLDWVTRHLKLTHYIYELASVGDVTAMSLRGSIHRNAHLSGNQIEFARCHIRDLRQSADLDESSAVNNETG